jgi:6-phosphogluconolactonase (cycloisomerase 2 family)
LSNLREDSPGPRSSTKTVKDATSSGDVPPPKPRKPRAPNRFMLSELTRTMRAAKQADVPIERYEVDPKTGKFTLYPKQESAPPVGDDEVEKWISKNAHQG